jgi:putative SOS response-associated peptidase YedK
MCGRFYLDAKTDELLVLFSLTVTPQITPRFNIAPSQNIAAVVDTPKGRHTRLFRWGLLPSWAKQSKPGFQTFNARIETLDSKPAFRTPFRTQRCLIPASGYFEWQATPTGKQPYCIRHRSDPIMAFAGLYDRWTGQAGESIDSCTLIVADASPKLQEIHNRMPVILSPGDFDAWLDRDNHDVDQLRSLLKNRQLTGFESYPVSARINNPRQDDPECIQPLGEEQSTFLF